MRGGDQLKCSVCCVSHAPTSSPQRRPAQLEIQVSHLIHLSQKLAKPITPPKPPTTTPNSVSNSIKTNSNHDESPKFHRLDQQDIISENKFSRLKTAIIKKRLIL
jgi:hypothetical protein